MFKWNRTRNYSESQNNILTLKLGMREVWADQVIASVHSVSDRMN